MIQNGVESAGSEKVLLIVGGTPNDYIKAIKASSPVRLESLIDAIKSSDVKTSNKIEMQIDLQNL
jgi:hypothetical protein